MKEDQAIYWCPPLEVNWALPPKRPVVPIIYYYVRRDLNYIHRTKFLTRMIFQIEAKFLSWETTLSLQIVTQLMSTTVQKAIDIRIGMHYKFISLHVIRNCKGRI